MIVLIAHPESRRARLFVESARSFDVRVVVVSHHQLIKDPDALLRLPDEPALVRLESMGEDFEFESILLAEGEEAAEDDGKCKRVNAADIAGRLPKEVLAPRQAHYGYLRYLDMLGERLKQRESWRVLSPIAEVKRCFDKNAAADWFQQLDVPITIGVPAPATSAECRAHMQRRGWRAGFLKMGCGSSASCLAVLRGRPDRPTLFTTLQHKDGRWFNSLKIQRLDKAEEIERAMAFLLGEGSRLEREHPKARHDDRNVDLRVLCIAGQPRFFVLRQSTHAITNLHLGGGRGDVEAFRARISEEAWQSMEQSCRTIAEASACFHLALDVLFEPDLKTHRIIEMNAFGDLLPGLKADGLNVYETQLKFHMGTGFI